MSEKRTQLIRQFRLKLHRFAGFGMGKRKSFCMQEKATEVLDSFSNICIGDCIVPPFIIDRVADHRVIDVGKMQAYLMGTARFYLDIEQSKFRKPLSHFPQRQSVTSR